VKIGPFHADTVDECLDILEDAFQSPMWKQLPEQEKTRLVGKLSHILENVEREDLGGVKYAEQIQSKDLKAWEDMSQAEKVESLRLDVQRIFAVLREHAERLTRIEKGIKLQRDIKNALR
jgi:hypothetical protein